MTFFDNLSIRKPKELYTLVVAKVSGVSRNGKFKN